MTEDSIIIKDIRLTNYRNFSNLRVKFQNNISNIVGLSSFGKTNLFETFKLFNNHDFIQESDIPHNNPLIRKEDIEIKFKLNSEFFKDINDSIKDDFYVVFKGGKKYYELRKYPKKKLDDDIYNEVMKNINICYLTFHLGRHLLEEGIFKEILSRPSFYKFLYNIFKICDINLKFFIENKNSEEKQKILENINKKMQTVLSKFSESFSNLTLKISLQNDEKLIIDYFRSGSKVDIYSEDKRIHKSLSLLLALKAFFNYEIKNSVILLDELWLHNKTLGFNDIQEEILKLSKRNQIIYTSRPNFEFDDNQVGKIINLDNEIKVQKLEQREISREKLLENIIKKSHPIENFPDNTNFLVLGRQWNSWYPSSFELVGGCYFFNINQEIIIIDPGFKTLDIIKEKNLDIRLIRHIFVTHFHPDHFENLIKLITRLTSETNKLTVYLNSTAFKQFKIYSRNFTKFNKLKPGVFIQLYEYNQKNVFQINIEVGRAFHREIGGYMNSISLKFFLTNNQTGKSYTIGFFGDTDGSNKYLDKYIKFYEDCDIIIPHLGAINKRPTGDKHLYKKGIKKILEKFDSKKFVFLGEYGFELASEQLFKNILKDLIPEHIKYDKLIRNFYLSTKNPNTIGDLFIPIFDFMINKLDSLNINLELILPFIIYSNYDKIDHTVNNFNIRNIKKLNLKNADFEKNYKEKDFIDIWREFLKFIIFQATSLSRIKTLVRDSYKLWGLAAIMENYENLLTKFFEFFTDDIKSNFLTKTLFSMTSYPISLNVAIGDIKNFINIDAVTYQPPAFDTIDHFPGVSQEIKEYFREENLLAIILILYVKFIIELFEKTKSPTIPSISDGREIICKYLNDQFIHKVLPVHPSYSIIFGNKELQVRGKCSRCGEDATIDLTQYNQNWTIIPSKQEYKKREVEIKGKKEECYISIIYPEYIDLIPYKLCPSCKVVIYEEEGFQIQESEMMRQQYQQEIEQIGEDIIEANRRIKSVNQPIAVFTLLNNLFDNNIAFNLDPELWRSKLNELIENNEDELINEILIHPNLQINTELKTFIISYFNQKSKDEIRQVFNQIITNPILYDNPSGDIFYYYYKIFDSRELLEVFNSKIDKLKIEELINFTNYLYNRESKRDKYQKDELYKFFKKKFILTFFPLIESVEIHIEDYKILRNKNAFFKQLNSLGYPFSNYVRILKNNLRKLRNPFPKIKRIKK